MTETPQRYIKTLRQLGYADMADAFHGLIVDRDRIADELQTAREDMRKRCADAALNEQVSVDEDDLVSDDVAYNLACEHVAAAIRALPLTED